MVKIAWIVAACSVPVHADDNLPRIIDAVAKGNSALYRVEPPKDADLFTNLPIGVFDSGIGGLTVLEAMLTIDHYNNVTHQPKPDGRPDLENERFIYLADQANMPYGNYCAAGNEPYLRELIVRDALFLLGQRYWSDPKAREPRFDKPPIKAIVIACNTATAYGIGDIRTLTERLGLPVPVIGVIEAGASGVVERLPTTAEPDAVAIYATVGTCSSGAYPRTIERMAGRAGRRVGTIVQHGSPGLAAAIEGTAGNVDDCIRADLIALVESYRTAGGERPISTVVLGCTHYPLEKARISKAFEQLREVRDPAGNAPFRNAIAADLTLVDPSQQTARQLYAELLRSRRLKPAADQAAALNEHRFFITVPRPVSTKALGDDGSFRPEYKVGRFAGSFDDEDFVVVPMAPERLSTATRDLLRDRLPRVWASWKAAQMPPPNVDYQALPRSLPDNPLDVPGSKTSTTDFQFQTPR
ncbi:MAG TPA: aspartate/glutamate racemase family protein [Pirellulales bacterium]|nr:aspartate/glutamate racemase family protein [Pirellulales bacterium]